MNKVLIVGRLTRDPLVQTTGSGAKYARITVAVTRRFNREQADFIPVVVWRQSAEFVEKYIKKGDLVSVEGSFSTGSYQKDGQTVYTYEVNADQINALGTRPQGERTTTIQTNDPVAAAPAQEAPATASNDDTPWEIDL